MAHKIAYPVKGPFEISEIIVQIILVLKVLRAYDSEVLKPIWEQLATDQSNPWQVVTRQVF